MSDLRDCSGCGEPKPPDAFRPDPRATDGRRRQCLVCEAARKRERLARRAEAETVPVPRRLRVLLVARLWAEDLERDAIAEQLAAFVGRKQTPRTVTRLLKDAKAELASWLDLTWEDRVDQSLADYRAIAADPDCPARDRVESQRAVDQLLKLRAAADRAAEASLVPGVGIDWPLLAAIAERLPELRERFGLDELEDTVPGFEAAAAYATSLAGGEVPTDKAGAEQALEERRHLLASAATYRGVIEDERTRHGDRVRARRALDQLTKVTDRRAERRTSASEAAAEERAHRQAAVLRRAHQTTLAHLVDSGLDGPDLAEAIEAETLAVIQASPWIPQEPFAEQLMFLSDTRREVLYGGAAGPGKSSALLMAALMYADVPGYSALVLRKRFPDLAQPGGIMDRCTEWLTGTVASAAGAVWRSSSHRASFPDGGVVQFGFVDRDDDKFKYQGGEYSLIAWDELTQFTEPPYRYLFSRLRRRLEVQAPLRMRSASNPGGVGHDWVRARMVDSDDCEVGFIPALIDNNPYLDREEYIASLEELDPTTLAQLLNGDWTARRAGQRFRREMFTILDELPGSRDYSRPVRYWDLGSTAGGGDGTSGTKLTRDDRGNVFVMDVVWGQWHSGDVEATIAETHRRDGRHVRVRIPIDRGQAGRSQVEHYRRTVVPLADFDGLMETGSKWVRAAPIGALAAQGRVYLIRGPWIPRWLDAVESFAEDPREYAHDDDVDSLAGGYQVLIEEPTRPWRPSGTPPEPPAETYQDKVRSRSGFQDRFKRGRRR